MGIGGEKGFLPGRHPIDAYGAGGFTFAGMSHRGSILALPSGIYAWDVTSPQEFSIAAFARVAAEAEGAIEHLLLGTGADMAFVPTETRNYLRAVGIVVEPMASAAAARTYNILLGERRRIAAALVAVP